MAIRQTPKRKQAYTVARRLYKDSAYRFHYMQNKDLYAFLGAEGYYWHADKGVWLKRPYVRSTFVDENGNSTGQIGLRVRANTGDLPEFYTWLYAALRGSRYAVTEESGPAPDDNGVSARLYLRLIRKVKQEKNR